jgi:hypothetical protein
MRKDLSEKTLHEATLLIANAHEWQISTLVEEYDGVDTIDGLIKFIKKVGRKEIIERAQLDQLLKRLELNVQEFPAWFADFIKHYYEEGFEKQWNSKHKNLGYEDAKAMADELQPIDFSLTDYMEEFTGRTFKGSDKIILYPSSFSRPQHAYGFSEEGHKVVVYQIGGSKQDAIGTAFHELLHPLIQGWWKAKRMKNPISELAEINMFKASWEKTGKGSYPYPNYWLDELVVHSVSNYMHYKAGYVSKAWVQQHSSYCSYEEALCDVFLDRYDAFNSIDDFLYYAITHIKVHGKGSHTTFVYVDESRQPHIRQTKGIIGVKISNWPTVEVIPKSPAEKAGLQTGDVIVKVNNEDVSHIKTVSDAIEKLGGPAGEILHVTIKRNEQILTFEIKRATNL